jgi:hypothetical protein
MNNPIGIVFGCVLVTLMLAVGPAVWWWDRRTEQIPAFETKVLFWKVGWKAPKSLAQQLAELKALQAKADRQARTIQTNQQSASAAISERQVVVQERIRFQTRTIIEKVPIYVTRETDQRYPLSNGFVLLHDAAATGADPDALSGAASEPHDAASDVASSQAIGVIAGNYGSCRSDAERLRGLQEWVRAMQAASAAPAN